MQIILQIQNLLLDEHFIECKKRLQELDEKSRIKTEFLYLYGLFYVGINQLEYAKIKLEQAFKQSSNRFIIVELLSIICAKMHDEANFMFYAKMTIALPKQKQEILIIPNWIGTFQQSYEQFNKTNNKNLAHQYYIEGDIELAIKHFKKCLDKNAQDFESAMMLGKCLIDINQPIQSLSVLQYAKTLNPDNKKILLDVAHAMVNCGLHDEATAIYQYYFENSSAMLIDYQSYLFHKLQDSFVALEDVEQIIVTYKTLMEQTNLQENFNKSKGNINIGILSENIINGIDLILQAFIDHNHDNTRIFLYNLVDDLDSVIKKKTKSLYKILNCKNLDEDTLSHIIFNDDINILINLDTNLKICHLNFNIYPVAPVIVNLFYSHSINQYSFNFMNMEYADKVEQSKTNSIKFKDGFFSVCDNHKLSLSVSAVEAIKENIYIGVFANFNDLSKKQIKLWENILKKYKQITIILYADFTDDDEVLLYLSDNITDKSLLSRF